MESVDKLIEFAEQHGYQCSDCFQPIADRSEANVTLGSGVYATVCESCLAEYEWCEKCQAYHYQEECKD